MKAYYVYVDWTLEKEPRVFYVGKGGDDRIKKRERNSDWKVIAEQLGWRREVVYVTHVEDAAYETEEQLVAYHDTFKGWGANHNAGGWGSRSGWTHNQETLKTMSHQKLGDNNPMKRAIVKARYFEGRFSEQTLRRHALKMRNPELRAKRSQQVTGEDNPRAKLTWDDVREIRALRSQGVRRCDLARRFSVSEQTIRLIVIQETWKE